MKTSERFVNAIQTALRARSWSQTDLAEKIGETRFWVSKLLNNRIKNLTRDQVHKIENLLELDIYGAKDLTTTDDPIAVAMAREVEHRPDTRKMFETLLEALNDDRLFELPTLDGNPLAFLGEQMAKLSEKAKSSPIEAAEDFLGLLQLELDNQKRESGRLYNPYNRH